MGPQEYDDQLSDLLAEFEAALREHLKTSDEFQDLLDYLTKKHGTISLYVAAQIMGAEIGGKKKTRKTAKKKDLPLRFELNRGDVDFLRGLKINADI